MYLMPKQFEGPMNLYNHNFGAYALNDNLYRQSLMARSGYHNPYWLQPKHMSKVTNDENAFQVRLDVPQFQPEEITVKTVDNAITVEGKHEEKQDEHGYISRHFVRRYNLPENVQVEQVQCNLSSDGVLTIYVPKKAAVETMGKNERLIPIQHPHANVPGMM